MTIYTDAATSDQAERQRADILERYRRRGLAAGATDLVDEDGTWRFTLLRDGGSAYEPVTIAKPVRHWHVRDRADRLVAAVHSSATAADLIERELGGRGGYRVCWAPDPCELNACRECFGIGAHFLGCSQDAEPTGTPEGAPQAHAPADEDRVCVSAVFRGDTVYVGSRTGIDLRTRLTLSVEPQPMSRRAAVALVDRIGRAGADEEPWDRVTNPRIEPVA